MVGKKYKYAGLSIELNRQCNLQCAFCCRGDAQNIIMSKEVIDRIFENVLDCGQIAFTGGEPLLHPELMDYFLKKIDENKWNTVDVQFTTNGTICDPTVIDMLNRFCSKRDGRTALIRVSADQFHDAAQSKRAIDYYSNLCARNPNILVVSEKSHTFWRTGRAKDLVKSQPDILKECRFIDQNEHYSHRVKIRDDEVICMLEISANGNVGFSETRDYESNDFLAFGNILENSMAELIQRNNNNCVLACDDIEKLCPSLQLCQERVTMPWEDWGKAEKDSVESFSKWLSVQFSKLLYERVLKQREFVHKKYPNIPVQVIIDELPMDKNVFARSKDILPKIQADLTIWSVGLADYIGAEVYDKYIGFLRRSDIATSVKNSLKLRIGILAYLLKTRADEFEPPETICHFEQLDAQYESGQLSKEDAQFFYCESDNVA